MTSSEFNSGNVYWRNFGTSRTEVVKIKQPTSVDKNNGTNDKFYRKVAILMYTGMFN